MADKRAYFKLDVGYMSNPKVLAVMDQSPNAILLHVASIGYAAQHLTDGVVPIKALLRMTGASEGDAQLLYAAGLWIDGPTGGRAEVHDYLEHQRSATEVKGASEKAKRAASARWDADADASSNAVSNASSMPNAMPDASESAMPREEREERERKNKDGGEEAAPATSAKSLALVRDRADVEAVCAHFADQREALGSKRPSITQKWRTEARLMLDSDGRTEEQIHTCIRWLFTSGHRQANFWRTNIRGIPRLRVEYDRLREAAEQIAVTGSRANDQTALLERAMVRAQARERGMA